MSCNSAGFFRGATTLRVELWTGLVKIRGIGNSKDPAICPIPIAKRDLPRQRRNNMTDQWPSFAGYNRALNLGKTFDGSRLRNRHRNGGIPHRVDRLRSVVP